MAYLTDCSNSTGCFVVFGGNRGTTVLSDTSLYWPDVGLTVATRCAVGGENAPMAISCPPNTYITAIPFASYGTNTGSCGAFILSSCHSPASMSAVLPCMGQNECSIKVENNILGDPCYGFVKRMAVQVTCTPNQGWKSVTPAGTAPTARSLATLTSSYDGRTAYLFGGQTAGGVSNAMYALSTAYGFAKPLSTELTNVALNKPAYQSTTDAVSMGTAGLAVNGAINTEFKSGAVTTCSQTNSAGSTDPW